MVLFIDGCDSIGKSYFVDLFQKFFTEQISSYKISEFSYKGSWVEKWIKIKKFLESVESQTGRGVIVDRSPLSEIVYNDSLTKIERNILLKLIGERDNVLILDRSYEKYLLYASLKTKKDDFDNLSEKEFYNIQRKFFTFANSGTNVHLC